MIASEVRWGPGSTRPSNSGSAERAWSFFFSFFLSLLFFFFCSGSPSLGTESPRGSSLATSACHTASPIMKGLDV